MPNPLEKFTSWLTGKKALAIPISQAVPIYGDGQPVWSDWSTEHAIHAGYKASGAVYTCVNRIGEALSSVPLKAYVKRGDDWEPAPDTPLQQLIDQPNTFFDGAEFIRYLSDHLLLGGNALWVKTRGSRGVVLELWPLMPDEVKPIRSRTQFISGYQRYMNGTRQPDLDVQDVLHVKLPDPGNLYWGASVLSAAAKMVDTDSRAIDWQMVTLQNRAMVPAIVGVQNMLEDTQYARLKAQMDRRRLGGSEAGKEVFVDGVGKIDVHRLGLTTQELDFIESRKMTREEVLSIFGVPPPVAGFYDEATYNNVETAYRIFWETRIITFARLIERVLNRSLVPEFGDANALYLGFDFSGVEALQENFSDKVANAKALKEAGFSLEAINRRLELDFTDEELAPPETPPPEPPDDALVKALAVRLKSHPDEQMFLAAVKATGEHYAIPEPDAARMILGAINTLTP